MSEIAYETRFSVKGTGTFPMDMLRYDMAFPTNPEAINQKGTRIVHLVARTFRNPHMPTLGRWNSFGWTVEHVTPPNHLED